MRFQLLIVGLVSIMGQVAVLRELNAAFYGVELTYILSIGVWMVFTAAGAYSGRRTPPPSRAAVSFLFLAAGLIIPAEIALARSIHFTLGGVAGTYLPVIKQISALVMILFPAGFSSGLLFQWTAKQYCWGGGSLAHAYAIESIGGIAGGLMSTMLLGLKMGNFSTAVICSAIAAGAGFISFPSGANSRGRYGIIAALLLIMTALGFSSRIDHWMTLWNYPGLVWTKDSPYGRITVVKREEQVIIFDNGSLRIDSQSAAAERFVHMTAIQHEAPESILICGAGEFGIVKEIRKYRPERIDYVEINDTLINAILNLTPSHFGQAPYSPPLNIEQADPRTFLQTSDRYDIIFAGAPPPDSGRTNRFYTAEFFDLCRSRLSPNGLLVFQLPSSENLWTSALFNRNAAIYSAVQSVFSDVLVIPGETDIFMASTSGLIRDPDQLVSRFIHRKIAARSVPPEYIRYAYTNDRFMTVKNKLQTADTPPNSDSSPAGYRYAMMHFLSRFIQIRGGIGDSAALPVGAVSVAVCLALGFAGRLTGNQKPEISALLQVFTAACIGMIMESILILDYEINCGVLFQNIGVLLMMFMAGLAAGSIAVRTFAESRTSGAPRGVHRISRTLFFSSGLFNTLFFILMYLDLSGNLLIVSGFLFLNGFMVAGVFACASLIFKHSPVASVSPIYAADVLGGSIGSVAGALILIPFLGAPGAIFLISGAAILFGALL